MITTVLMSAALLTAGAPDSATPASVKQVRSAGFAEIVVLGVVPGDEGHTVLLGDLVKRRFIPMGVGATEALSIHTRLEGKRYARPLTHDLLDQMIGRLGGTLVKVHIDDLREGVFYGTVYVKTKTKTLRFDARPSDAIALALSAGKPIFMARNVLEESAIPIPQDIDTEPEPEPEPEAKKPVYTL
jgi:bifunctional DNase/RNase